MKHANMAPRQARSEGPHKRRPERLKNSGLLRAVRAYSGHHRRRWQPWGRFDEGGPARREERERASQFRVNPIQKITASLSILKPPIITRAFSLFHPSAVPFLLRNPLTLRDLPPMFNK